VPLVEIDQWHPSHRRDRRLAPAKASDENRFGPSRRGHDLQPISPDGQVGGAAPADFVPDLNRHDDPPSQTYVKIHATRLRLTDALRDLSYYVPESQANIVWCVGGSQYYLALKVRKIFVRLMHYPGFSDGLRITVGIDSELAALLEALHALV
jgi:hypothetical protein